MEVKLTRRQNEVAELISCGLSQKEIADILGISQNTVDNTIRNLKERTGFNKMTELAVWKFAQARGISIDFKELRKKVIAAACLFLVVMQIINDPTDVVRARRARSGRRSKTEIEYVIEN
jgi:DNA-binding CsgD family transcriptional regulator